MGHGPWPIERLTEHAKNKHNLCQKPLTPNDWAQTRLLLVEKNIQHYQKEGQTLAFDAWVVLGSGGFLPIYEVRSVETLQRGL